MNHANGPWVFTTYSSGLRVICDRPSLKPIATLSRRKITPKNYAKLDEAARIIAAAPAMAIALEMLELDLATLERDRGVTRFHVGGYGYCHGCDWTDMVDAIGWSYCRSAIDAVRGAK